MFRRARWRGLAILLGIFGGRWGPAPARADEEPEAPAPTPTTEEPLLWQWFDVGSLTAERTDFGGPRGPFPTPPDRFGDEVMPFLSSVFEEGTKPFGSITDVIDLVRRAIPASEWEREGLRVDEQGTGTLRVRAPKATLDRIETCVLDLEREAMRTMTLDAVVLRGHPATLVGPGRLSELVAGGELTPLVGVRAVGMPGQVVAARTGGEQSHVADHDVEVAIDSKGIDPIVGVLLDGLALRAQLASATDTRARGILQAWWAAPARLSTHRSAAGDVLEVPEVDGRSWNLVYDVTPGSWTLLPSTGGIFLAVRLTVTTPASRPAGPAPLARLPRGEAVGPLEAHRWDVRDLAERIVSFRGSSLLHLDPSNFTPPEPPELPEPAQAFPLEALVDTLHELADEAAFLREGSTVEVRNGMLFGSVDAGTARIVDGTLAAIRARFLGTTRLRGTVLSLPLASFPEYLAGLDDGASLLADGGTALLRRPGARVVDRCALRLQPGQRGAVVGGRQHSYVADYDVEIAEKSLIGNPIVRAWLEGLSLDVSAHRTHAGEAVCCVMRLERSTKRGSRAVPTPYGAIDCPSIGVQRVSGAFALPVGGSRIVAAHLEGGVVTLVILGAAAE